VLFDVAIIGGGPGGYAAAIRASQLGLHVALMEKEHLGGTCLNRGCIPTKALLQAAKVKHFVDVSGKFGVDATINSINCSKMVARSDEVISSLRNGISSLMKKNGISVIDGAAKFLASDRLLVSDSNNNQQEVSAKNVIVATGATPKIPSWIAQELIDNKLIWTSTQAMSPKKIPSRILILGSGAVGVEFASFYNTLGSDVTIFEIQNRILIHEDEEIAKLAQKLFSQKGIKVRTGVTECRFSADLSCNDLCVESYSDSADVFDACIVAIGVVPNTSSLNLEAIGVRTRENGAIVVNENMETSVAKVFAIGDVANAPLLAHKASKEGVVCAERIAGVSSGQKINYKCIPSCIYSNPQIASIGLTEKDAAEQVVQIKVGRSSFNANGKAKTVGESDGFVKVILDAATGEILGAHMMGYEVTELLPIFSLAISSELTAQDVISAIFPHPTMSESLQAAVEQALFNCS
jgi:dihydrolipoamide dehydrogenase